MVISPLGTTATEARRRRAAQNPEYAQARERNAAARKIARQLIYYRTVHGLTQRELAEQTQTSYSQISRLESGDHLPSLASLIKLACALGLKVSVSFERQEAESELIAAD